jgi:hypothetical protein
LVTGIDLWGTVVGGVLGFGHDEVPALERVLQAEKPLDILFLIS